jgi:N-carbamoyl-L-amino-acid hydrolase
MAELAPAGMIFIPSRDGRSHCPEEWSDFDHVALGTDVLAETILLIDKEENL